jgi:hypothetical protein
MKEIEMTIHEFLNFRVEALAHYQVFTCEMQPTCNYIVKADIDFLTYLGF